MEEQKKEFHPKQVSQTEMNEITGKIDAGLKEFIKTGHYKDVLIKMGNIGRYSLNNQIYILLQNPNATTVNGMKGWNRLGRHVKPGEHAIRIFSPIVAKEEVEMKDKDGKPKLGPDGNPLIKEENVVKGYQLSYVFDVTQTDGMEIDAYRFDEKKIVESKDKILKGLEETVKKKGYAISFADDLGPGVYGLCDKKNRKIQILKGMSDLQTVSTAVHECGHALAHSDYRPDFEGLTPLEMREIKEVEAESIACVVCSYLGLDTTNFNFSYIAGWAEGDIEKFHKNLDVISKHAKTLINGIEDELEKGKEKEMPKEIPKPWMSNPSQAEAEL